MHACVHACFNLLFMKEEIRYLIMGGFLVGRFFIDSILFQTKKKLSSKILWKNKWGGSVEPKNSEETFFFDAMTLFLW